MRESEQLSQQIRQVALKDSVQIAARRQIRIKENMKRIAASADSSKTIANTRNHKNRIFGKFQKNAVIKINKNEKDLDTIQDVASHRENEEDLADD